VANAMYECEVKKPFQREGRKVFEWVERPVSSLGSGPIKGGIRCKHCHGAVRVHKQQVGHGPADHVEHLSHADSVNCLGGHYFCGTHRLSDDPVV